MSLIHALVAQGSTILAEHQAGKRDFSQATQTILSKIPPNNSKLTYVWEQYLFHYISEGGFTYLVMADDSAGRRMPFTFLGELQRKFLSTPSASSSSSSTASLPPHALQSTFGPVVSQLVYTYNTSPPEDDLSRAQSELAQVKDIMVQNVEQILSRGERIELLVDKTDTMASQATAFRRGARTVRRQMWWKNKRVLGLGVLVALVRMPRFSPLLICTLLDPVHSPQVILWVIMAQFCGAALRCGAK
ncbi:synaptobrevin-domain-containing protein [Russula brevipes]|nr:synaptobrevin-domain-containing protein [Russula brevipes]